jgi:hypothetical protein
LISPDIDLLIVGMSVLRRLDIKACFTAPGVYARLADSTILTVVGRNHVVVAWPGGAYETARHMLDNLLWLEDWRSLVEVLRRIDNDGNTIGEVWNLLVCGAMEIEYRSGGR